MKKINILILGFMTLFVMSCGDEFLSPLPESSIVTDTYFSTDAELEAGIIAIYDAIQGQNSTSTTASRGVINEYYVTEMRSDNTQTKSSEGEAAEFESYTITANNGIIADYYRSFYKVIFRANTVLESLDVATDANRTAYEAEAKFTRAYAYFNLVRLYGDIPLVSSTISPADTDIQYTRVATTQVYDLIVSDLETAIAGLTLTNRNRGSKAAAQGLLAKVHLTLGNYTQAQVLCESIISSGNFDLAADFTELFYTEANAETIFSIGYTTGLTADSQFFSAEWMNAVGRTSGVNYVTQDAVDVLEALGGSRVVESYRIDPFQTQFFQVIKYLPNGEDGGANGKTFVQDAALSGNDWIVLRFADVLLMHVEAIMGGSGSTSNSNAIASFKRVRDRAGLPTPAVITSQELLDERRVELAFENQRFFDLVRFGQAQSVLSTFASANGLSFSSSDLLLPIPQYEINLSNGLLTQNPIN